MSKQNILSKVVSVRSPGEASATISKLRNRGWLFINATSIPVSENRFISSNINIGVTGEVWLFFERESNYGANEEFTVSEHELQTCIECPVCQISLKLDENEKQNRQFLCPKCNNTIPFDVI